ncbi:orotidine-5'-phosphate decarboxylase [Legionella dresdenensis]|uniref:Orotidine 5'-phosphate decarboxylase n=1 Tax=Legionella dresdenensis TaxID=450200 RepID=A0ABV8CI34_9GAMM
MAKLIIALDYAREQDAFKLLDQLDPAQCALKVGSEMFTHFGTDFVSELIKRQYKVFLDLKFHDIPNTVAHACKAAAELGVWMLNVHASGGLNMMKAAVDSLLPYGDSKPLLIAVTVLTSMDEEQISEIGVNGTVEQQVSRLARLANQAGLDGVVCSAHETSQVKNLCGDSFLTVTPGIRLIGDNTDDQSRIMTPEHAARLGSDFLVVGRSITRAENPAEIVAAINEVIKI